MVEATITMAVLNQPDENAVRRVTGEVIEREPLTVAEPEQSRPMWIIENGSVSFLSTKSDTTVDNFAVLRGVEIHDSAEGYCSEHYRWHNSFGRCEICHIEQHGRELQREYHDRTVSCVDDPAPVESYRW